MRITVATQNMTEGPVTREVGAADIACGQEITADAIRAVPGRKEYLPAEDPHLAILWNPDTVRPAGHGYVIKVHGSGAAEHYPVPTPARHVLVKQLEVGAVPLWVICGWPINSAWNLKPDRHKALRRDLWHRYMDVVVDQVRAAQRADALVIPMGDFNRFRGHFTPPGCREATGGRGLDRIFYSDDPRIRLVGQTWEGPITGVGRDLKHKSQHATFEIKESR